ncbi:hypothetical protein FF38_09242 [Lucilia cuprina]|uniref:C2H2-type domain-containing protein n=1 Tax=Lucilia cuprina TaxID=7375 RepID=A0A0L0CNC9_LUCCU|nr:hypothetical protein FF38_09242 [Lucilia cuprina]
MEMECFLCKASFDSRKKLLTHLNKCGLPSKDFYECTFLNCFQKFQIKWSFQRHIYKHFDVNQTVELPAVNTDCDNECDEFKTECNISIREKVVNESEKN